MSFEDTRRRLKEKFRNALRRMLQAASEEEEELEVLTWGAQDEPEKVDNFFGFWNFDP